MSQYILKLSTSLNNSNNKKDESASYFVFKCRFKKHEKLIYKFLTRHVQKYSQPIDVS